jgi:hypothetical protein
MLFLSFIGLSMEIIKDSYITIPDWHYYINYFCILLGIITLLGILLAKKWAYQVLIIQTGIILTQDQIEHAYLKHPPWPPLSLLILLFVLVMLFLSYISKWSLLNDYQEELDKLKALRPTSKK